MRNEFADSRLNATYGWIADARDAPPGGFWINVSFGRQVGVAAMQTLDASFGDYYVSRARIYFDEFGAREPGVDAQGNTDLDLRANRCFARITDFNRTHVVDTVSIQVLDWGCGDGVFGGPALRFGFLGCEMSSV